MLLELTSNIMRVSKSESHSGLALSEMSVAVCHLDYRRAVLNDRRDLKWS